MSASRGRAMSWLWRDDEEMAKKDDDIRLPAHAHAKHHPQWQTARAPRRTAITRLAAYAFVIFLLIFVLGKALSAGPPPSSSHRFESVGQSQSAKMAPGRDTGGGAGGDRSYNAPVRFPALAASIKAIGDTNGAQEQNRNVLFAAASLRSVAELLPMACQMANERESYVHFMLISRSDIPINELLKINGIDGSCSIVLHDARPDKSMLSSETRMLLATMRALYHVEANMHPQAIIIDSTNAEETYFLSGMRDGTRSMKSALIELPERASTRLSWITKLDSASLGAWNRMHFDIIVHVPPNSSGNLRRFLKSLSRADLGGLAPPHITVELPNVLEPTTETMLSEFQWPPPDVGSGHPTNMLSLRRRIPRQRLTEEESAVRFLESFWPANVDNAHVLILSAHTELTPQFFHYVKYTLLRHRYTRLAAMQELHSKLMGISFSTPSTLLDGSGPFTLPTPLEETTPASSDTPFLWQAPSSDAILFFGDNWVELHGYVSQLLEKLTLSSTPLTLLANKEVSRNYPSWLEFVLQLSRIRGYFTLYPGRETADAVIGVHTELNDKPEEYQGTENDSGEELKEGLRSQTGETFDYSTEVDMLKTLPQGGTLHVITGLPLVSWEGKQVHREDIDNAALEYAKRFRREVGQCENTGGRPDKQARDLFCKSTGAKA